MGWSGPDMFGQCSGVGPSGSTGLGYPGLIMLSGCCGLSGCSGCFGFSVVRVVRVLSSSLIRSFIQDQEFSLGAHSVLCCI